MEKSLQKKSAFLKGRLFRVWLPAAAALIVLLLVAVALLAEHLLSSPVVREKISQALMARTGMEISYRQIGIDYFPRPSLEVRQPAFSLPGQVQGKAENLRISPRIAGLLTGTTGLGTVELEQPDIQVELPETLFAEKEEDTVTAPGGKVSWTLILQKLQQVVPVMGVKSVDGRFTVFSGTRKLRGEHLNLQLDGVVEDNSSGSLSLRMDIAELILTRGEEQETIAGLSLQGDIRMSGGDLSCRLQRLAATHPALALSGTYTDLSSAPEVLLKLDGTDIDVEATRKTALALAGEISPVKEIFTYLGGGKVPRISFSSQGKTFADLGELNAIRIEGELRQGSVSVPEAALDLSEVSGTVTLLDGILGGTGLTARLGNSSAHSGLLRIGLGGDSDLFQLELLADADLAETQKILKRLIDQPTINRELDLISNLAGRGVGKLVLGDSFGDLKAAIEDAEISLSLDYRKVPLPITITTGRLNYAEDLVALQALAGTLGASKFSGVDATVSWTSDIRLELRAEEAMLVTDELYPWLHTLPGVEPFLREFSEVSGGITLSSLSFAGNVRAPEQWLYGAAGTLNTLKFVTRHFPGPIRLVTGGFQLDRKQLSLENVEAAGLDARLRVTGTLSGYLEKSGPRVALTVDGAMGDEAIAWLEKKSELPESYSIRTPVTLQGLRVAWQQKKGATVSGGLTVKDGPRLDLDLRALPEGLQVRKLAVKDQYSDARMTFSSVQDNPVASFNGSLQSETVGGLFVGTAFFTGSVAGDFSVTLPGKAGTMVSATGRLQGRDLSIPLEAGNNLSIGRLQLEAEGSGVKADGAALFYRGFEIDPLRATVDLLPGRIEARVDQAGFCGVDAPGVVKIAGKEVDLLFQLKGEHVDIRSSYTCLTQGMVKMTGRMDIAGRISARGEMAELLGSMEGPLEITFRNGVIEQNKMLAAILEVLNVTEIVKGRLPSMSTAGFKYTTITVEGQFGNGKFRIKKLYMDGETLDILGYGEIDMEQETVKMELLAAPFQTVDTIVKYIPGVNYLLGGSLVAIPVSVQGKLADPRVWVLSPASVSKSLLNLGARTITFPFKLIESLIPGGK